MTRVLVTGVTGFIGSYLSMKLVEKGFDVWGVARFHSQRQILPDGVKVYQCDITDPYSVAQMMRDIRPNVVYHLAAMTPVALSYNMPRYYMEVNYNGTINIVEAWRRIVEPESQILLVYASTSEVYGQQDKFPLKEEYMPKPNTPYSISKYAGELYVKYYATEAFKLPVVVVRPFNTYNRAHVRQRHYVVEKIITSMILGAERIHLGDPNTVRDFLYRDDHVEGYIRVLETALEDKERIIGETFNLATSRGVTIRELVEIARKLTGWDGEVVWYTHIRPADIRKLIGSYEKAKKKLGWQPKHTLEEGLRKTIDEWKKVLNA